MRSEAADEVGKPRANAFTNRQPLAGGAVECDHVALPVLSLLVGAEFTSPHLTMGGTALIAGLCLVLSEYGQPIGKTHGPNGPFHAGWKRAWGLFVLIIGIQLLTYTE